MANGRVVKTSHFALHHWSAATHSTPGPGFDKTPALFLEGAERFGALIPKRWAKKAVTRNLIRRQIRETVRTQAHLPATVFVVRLKAEFDRRRFLSASSQALQKTVRAELKQLFAKLQAPA